MLNDISKIMFDEKQIDDMVEKLADRINSDYKGKQIILVGLLKGSVVFLSDLMRKITVPCNIDFMIASSYGSSTVSSGNVKISRDLSDSIEGKNVIIVEDIVDSGNTLSCLLELLKCRKPESLRLCSLLSKLSRREKEVYIDYLGTEIPDEFVVGYGLDYNELYRNLPYLCVLKPEVYSA